MQTKTLKIHPKDNVAVALTVLYDGEQVSDKNFPAIEIKENIPAKHKFALQDFNEGDAIIMYGVLVGKAEKFIPQGGLLSTQNIRHASSSFQLKERHTNWHKPDISGFSKQNI